MSHFNPNLPGDPSRLFGLPYSPNEAEIVIIPIPWDVTVSYGSGTNQGPNAIMEASPQIDYCIAGIQEPWQLSISMTEINQEWLARNRELRREAERYIKWIEGDGKTNHSEFQRIREKINQASGELNQWLFKEANQYLDQGKLVATLGGDHSTPFGLLTALGQRYDDFGILQIDAHMDLRHAYEGFDHSHASIMYNAMQIGSLSRLVQVGIRDYCQEEEEYANHSQGKVIPFYDQEMREKLFVGQTWQSQAERITNCLPDHVYVSFDIDGLDPKLCPNTGTPVPGGLDFWEAVYLIKSLVRSGKKIIGFDLSEVCPGKDQWDGNVGARILYQLCIYAGVSQGKI